MVGTILNMFIHIRIKIKIFLYRDQIENKYHVKGQKYILTIYIWGVPDLYWLPILVKPSLSHSFIATIRKALVRAQNTILFQSGMTCKDKEMSLKCRCSFRTTVHVENLINCTWLHFQLNLVVLSGLNYILALIFLFLTFYPLGHQEIHLLMGQLDTQ